MFEVVIEVFFGGLLRALKTVLIEVLFEVVCYGVGFFILKVITFGKFPQGTPSTAFSHSPYEDFFVGLVGLVVIAASGIFISNAFF